MFVDLVGYTALAEAQGDDRAAEVAIGLRARAQALLSEFGATEVKALGDGLMLRCAEAEKAIGLGLRLVDELEEAPEFPPVRAGVHTGTAVERDGDWYGNAVNVASRLCAAAGGGQVLVSEAARRAAGRTREIDFGEEQLHWLRNVTQPVAARIASRCEEAELSRPRRWFDRVRPRRGVLSGLARNACPKESPSEVLVR